YQACAHFCPTGAVFRVDGDRQFARALEELPRADGEAQPTGAPLRLYVSTHFKPPAGRQPAEVEVTLREQGPGLAIDCRTPEPGLPGAVDCRPPPRGLPGLAFPSGDPGRPGARRHQRGTVVRRDRRPSPGAPFALRAAAVRLRGEGRGAGVVVPGAPGAGRAVP